MSLLKIIAILLSPDINECAGINPCQQLCENTDGSYTCSCTEGFNLTASTGTCTGRSIAIAGKLCLEGASAAQ